MPGKTAKLGLNTFLENEVVNYEQINDNFEKIDDCCMCYEDGRKISTCSGDINGQCTWHYKKFTNNEIEMSAKMEFANVKCDGGSAAPYYSGIARVEFPFALSSVYDVQMHLASNTIGWVSDITGKSVVDSVSFRVMSMNKETTEIYKQVFITVKGTLKS